MANPKKRFELLHSVMFLLVCSRAAGSCHPEGFVIRAAKGFPLDEFDRHVAKYVREGHVQTDESWRRTWKQAKLNLT